MKINELVCLTQRILASAVGWRQEQSALVQTIHASTVAILHEGDEVSVRLVLGEVQRASEEMGEEHRETLQKYSSAEINSAVQEFLDLEFHDLSAIFGGLYAEFNQRYFAGRLPTYRVAVMHGASNAKVEPNLARIDHHRLEIVIAYDGRPEEMVSLLVDTMAHIAAGLDPETAWQQELTRLYRGGAPTRNRVSELDDDVVWPHERSRCCLVDDRFDIGPAKS